MKPCELCKKIKTLKKSHIFPRFIVTWLRESGTGRFRNPENPNKPAQDGPKKYLLCGDCEQKFGNKETLFRNQIFYPFIDSKLETIRINDDTKYFFVSILWRVLCLEYEHLNKSKYFESIKKLEKEFRNYLNHDIPLSKFDNIHLIVTPSDVLNSYNYIPNFNRYMTRDLDGTIVSNNELCFLYSKFSRFIIIAEVENVCENVFKETRVEIDKKLNLQNQTVNFPPLFEFLITRVKNGNALYDSRLTENQENKILNRINKNWSTIEKSDYIIAIKSYFENK